MTDPVLKKKWSYFFHTFLDTNKNGTVEWADFELVFQRVGETGTGTASTEYRIITDGCRMVWKGLLHEIRDIDITSSEDQDVEITLDEWIHMWEKYNPRHQVMWQWEYLKFMFFLLDTNGDKIVDKDEYGAVLKLYGVPKADADKAYAKLVSGEKKELDWGLFVKSWNMFFTSKDKEASGNALFGVGWEKE